MKQITDIDEGTVRRIDLGRWMNEEYSVDTVNLDKLEEAIAGVEEENAQEERGEDDGPN